MADKKGGPPTPPKEQEEKKAPKKSDAPTYTYLGMPEEEAQNWLKAMLKNADPPRTKEYQPCEGDNPSTLRHKEQKCKKYISESKKEITVGEQAPVDAFPSTSDELRDVVAVESRHQAAVQHSRRAQLLSQGPAGTEVTVDDLVGLRRRDPCRRGGQAQRSGIASIAQDVERSTGRRQAQPAAGCQPAEGGSELMASTPNSGNSKCVEC